VYRDRFAVSKKPFMKDLAAAFTIFFITLGPIKIVPPFFLMTYNKEQHSPHRRGPRE